MTESMHRTNLYLYREDYEFLLARFGYGWTSHVRELIHEAVKTLQRKEPTFRGVPISTAPIDLDRLIREQDNG